MDEETSSIDTDTEPTEKEQDDLDKAAQLRRLKGWYRSDASRRSKWSKQADEDFAFIACDQWSKDDEQFLKDNGRVPVVFNRVLTIIKSIAGSEINGRLDTTYLPRNQQDVKANELLSAASDWMSDGCDAEDEQSEAFESAMICGEGWTEARLSYDEEPEGKYEEVEVDPREMFPDCKARKKNFSDARRVHRVRKMSITEARAMFPNEEDEDLDADWASYTSSADQKDPKPVEDKRHEDDDLDDPVTADRSDVTIVHSQWWTKEAYYLVAQEPGASADPMQAAPGAPPALPGLPQPAPAMPMPGMPPQQPAMPGMSQMASAPPPGQDDQTNAQPTPSPQSSDDPEELSVADFKIFSKRAKEIGIRFHAVKLMRKVYKQAFLGSKILGEIEDTPCPYEFSFNCITGERDRKNNTFFGLVRVMRDPQMWANKMLSNALHIANTTAKGGIIAERTAFDDERQAEDSYAQPNEITWASDGAVSSSKIMPKPGTGDPSVYLKLLEFAIASIRDVTGVNLELLGLRDANQPGVLEAQRKQAAMTVLAGLFNSLRRFRLAIGRIRLHLIQTHLSDGRLIRIAGPDGAQAVPLIREKTLGEYDVIVADAPTSPNQKEATWALINQILPVFKDMLTPDVTLTILEYSPLPSDLVEKLRTLKQQADQTAAATAQSQQQLQQQAQQLMMAGAQAKIGKDNASASEISAKAQHIGSNVQADNLKGAAEAEATRVQGRAAAMKTMAEANATHSQGIADALATHSQTQSKSSIDAATIQQIIADTAKSMAQVFDQKIQTLLSMQGQAHQQQSDAAQMALRQKDGGLKSP